MPFTEMLSKLLESPAGQAVAGVVALSVVYMVFGAARALLNRWKAHVKTTETELDDEIAEIVEDVLDSAQGKALDHVKKKRP